MRQPAVIANPSLDFAGRKVRAVKKAIGKDYTLRCRVHVESLERCCGCKARPCAGTTENYPSCRLAADASKRCQKVFHREGKPSSGPHVSSADPREPGNRSKTIINRDHRQPSLSKRPGHVMCFRLIEATREEAAAMRPE